jgi:hypothetical protein
VVVVVNVVAVGLDELVGVVMVVVVLVGAGMVVGSWRVRVRVRVRVRREYNKVWWVKASGRKKKGKDKLVDWHDTVVLASCSSSFWFVFVTFGGRRRRGKRSEGVCKSEVGCPLSPCLISCT